MNDNGEWRHFSLSSNTETRSQVLFLEQIVSKPTIKTNENKIFYFYFIDSISKHFGSIEWCAEAELRMAANVRLWSHHSRTDIGAEWQPVNKPKR